MEHPALAGHSADPAVEDGFVGPVARSWPGDNIQSLSGSSRSQVLDHSPHPTHAKMPRQSHIRAAPEQSRNPAAATTDSRDPKNGWCTPVAIAFARRHPQITHAHATSCGVYTCAHTWWRRGIWIAVRWGGSTESSSAGSVPMRPSGRCRCQRPRRSGRRGSGTATRLGSRWVDLWRCSWTGSYSVCSLNTLLVASVRSAGSRGARDSRGQDRSSRMHSAHRRGGWRKG
jgi:hypothetical protein